MKTLIKIHNLTFTYPRYSDSQISEPPLFDNLHYSIHQGELHTIIGAPESGKTTLSRILTGLVPRYTGGSLEGQLTLFEKNVRELRPQDMIEIIGTIFQNPDDQILTTRVDSEIAYPLESLGYAPSAIAERVERELARFGLEEKAGRNPATLSGGEKKRLLCAVLAAVAPPVWVLDETLDEMDSQWRQALLEYLTQQNSTVLLFTSKMPSSSTDPQQQHRAILSQGRLHSEAEAIDRIAERDGLRLLPAAPAVAKDKTGAGDKAAETKAEPGGKAEDAGPVLLEAEALSFRYPGLTDFSLEIDHFVLRAGETLTLAGPNGCGKTTLAKLLCGLYSPQQGAISLPGRADGPAALELLRSSAAYLFQNPDYQIFLPSIEEELAYGLKEKGLSRERVTTLVQSAIQNFRLPPAETSPTLLSYGTRKRLQAATYWLLQRPICIFDETDSGISPKDFAALIDAFKSPDRALLIISHDAELAQHYSNRILRMEAGRLKPEADS
ncbi:MAG: energy-coupling factor ABC transporter ATP-binding protein [Spirochaetaceae bacterium]|nr:energy-coupling factor ABC transporter ATP-binding protein [Spirochaetaceae bacterium]MCF7947220.1 energy-coupling factor ABC transporter ATP-binding protein [Spirochaetia bacterium]MCF7950259.1 energy-coupling factor ABC transporter ATP-binding protein [Spirochaetaceae bacterium]